jgi:DNA-binding SARP family transcriptional activator/tetratricopeptide (TPR) repeat protein
VSLTFRLLGAVEARSDGEPLVLPRAAGLTVLAGLLLNANRLVGAEQLTGYVWEGTPPHSAKAALHNHISRLRKIVGDGVIHTVAGSYVLRATASNLDSLRFDELVSSAGEVGDHDAALLLEQALHLWHEPLLDNVASEILRRSEVPRLTERYLLTQEQYGETCLRLGHYGKLSGQLTPLLHRHPFRERLVAQLMLALFHSGRQADALMTYHRTRRLLDDQLAVPPGRELRELYLQMLKPDEDLLPAVRPVADATSGRHTALSSRSLRNRMPSKGDVSPPDAHVEGLAARPTPSQLPPDVSDFTGRTEETDTLHTWLTRSSPVPVGTRIVALAGPGGVGKTGLAVHVAHQVAADHPDGQLFIDLRSNGGRSMRPDDVLAGFLRALGVVGVAVPDDSGERELLYRSLLADRRMLVVLDNADNEAQVRPLIPGGPGCSVVLTGRRRLTGLPGVRHVELTPLPVAGAVEFLGRALGEQRVAAEPGPVRDLVELCGGLPLALRIASARLAAKPHWRVEDLTRRLRASRHPLSEFTHAGLDVRASMALSYDALSSDARRMFRRISLMDAPDLPAWAGAALLDIDVPDAEDLLEQLVDAYLVQASEHALPDRFRYRLHDLVRSYAHERALLEEDHEELGQALRRALGGWLALAEQAHRVVYGGDYSIIHGPAERWGTVRACGQFGSARAALSWMDSERLAIRTAILQAPDVGADDLCWDLAWTAATLYEAYGYYDDWRLTAETALAVARKTGNQRAEASMLRSLASLSGQVGDDDGNEALSKKAAEIFNAIGDQHGFALARQGLGVAAARRDQADLALLIFKETRDLLHLARDRYMEAAALRAIAQVHLFRHDDATAEEVIGEALAIFRDLEGGRGQAQALQVLGEIRLHQQRYTEAEEVFREFLGIVRDIGERYGEVYALTGLGEALAGRQLHTAAEDALQHALALARQFKATLLEGRALLALGELRLPHDIPAAVSLMEQSIALFDSLAATQWSSQARRALRGAIRDG